MKKFLAVIVEDNIESAQVARKVCEEAGVYVVDLAFNKTEAMYWLKWLEEGGPAKTTNGIGIEVEVIFLLDLNFPADADIEKPDCFPFGFELAMKARKLGCKSVICTDLDGHDDYVHWSKTLSGELDIPMIMNKRAEMLENAWKQALSKLI